LINILLIDDEKDIVDLFHQFFLQSGFSSNAYSNPYLALEDFMKNQNNYYNLVISDIRMPEINGIDLATTIRKINKDIPIILMSVYDVIDIDHLLLQYLNIEDIIINQ
jgi:two-component system, OmpR family, response regulator